MLVGLADDDTDDDTDDSEPFVQSSSTSTLTFAPLTITAAKPKTATIAPRPPTAAGSAFLDKVLPRKTGADGQVRIWGLPPAVAYVIALILVGGGGYLAIQKFRGGRRVATNPRRRRGARRARRSKR